jgi:hypothetical protein
MSLRFIVDFPIIMNLERAARLVPPQIQAARRASSALKPSQKIERAPTVVSSKLDRSTAEFFARCATAASFVGVQRRRPVRTMHGAKCLALAEVPDMHIAPTAAALALSLVVAAVPALAQTPSSSVTVTGLALTLTDLNPNDGITPTVTFDTLSPNTTMTLSGTVALSATGRGFGEDIGAGISLILMSEDLTTRDGAVATRNRSRTPAMVRVALHSA